MKQLATAARPLRIAIIGAGPAGLYAAEALLKQRDTVLTVDIFNRFPTPFGLVRDGVAPDHQSIKAVIRVFAKVLADPRMGIPGEEAPHGLPATAFVSWYNGHPSYHDLPIDLSCERVVVVGNSNAAMYVTRMLVMSPDVLMKTDIAAHALKKLRESKIREVVILGRRGAAQASFTNPEIKELGKLEAVKIERNELVVAPNGELGAKGTGKFERIEAGLVLRSIGYRSVPIEGVPFDHTTSTMSNSAGRSIVTDPILATHIARHQDKDQATIGVMVMALGTPAGPDDIEAYYTHMRGGHPPSPELLSDLQRRYAAIGGRSPLLEHTQAQARGLQAALDQADPGRFRVTLGMQHSRPFIEDSLAELVESGVQQVVGLVLAPHYSRLSVGVYRERLKAANTPSLPLSVIEHWHQAPGYLDFLETSLQATLEKMIRKHGVDANKIEVLFTAHSLPMRILAVNDPYPEQVRETAEAVASRLSLQRWAIAWQSAGRTAEPWIGPALLDVLAKLPGRGGEGVVVCSAGFVSDHLEILYDLDIEARQAAQRLGLAFERTPMPNDDPSFLAALASVVRSHVEAGDGKS